MLKIGVVDDEQIYLDKIYTILINNFDGIKIYKYHSVIDIDQDIDFLLLDIAMPDADGIYFSKKNQNIKIIFVTNYDTRIKEAFGPNIYGYVSKNNIEIELIEKVAELNKLIRNNYLVTFRVKGLDVGIRIDDIIYFQYIGGRIVSIIYGNKFIMVSNTTLIKEMNKLDERFIKINRETVINKNKIIDFDKQYVYLDGVNSKFEVSVRKRKLVKQHFYKSKQMF